MRLKLILLFVISCLFSKMKLSSLKFVNYNNVFLFLKICWKQKYGKCTEIDIFNWTFVFSFALVFMGRNTRFQWLIIMQIIFFITFSRNVWRSCLFNAKNGTVFKITIIYTININENVKKTTDLILKNCYTLL